MTQLSDNALRLMVRLAVAVLTNSSASDAQVARASQQHRAGSDELVRRAAILGERQRLVGGN